MFISARSLCLLRFSINFGSFFQGIPFRWSRENFLHVEIPKFSKTKRNYWSGLGWICIKWFLLFHQAFLSVRLLQSISAQNLSAHYYVEEAIYYIQFLVPCINQITLILHGPAWTLFLNECFNFFNVLESKLNLRYVSLPTSRANTKIWICIYFAS
jgi:hypothetical protein